MGTISMQCEDDPALRSVGIHRKVNTQMVISMKSICMSMTKVCLQVGEHCLWLDGFHRVYLSKTRPSSLLAQYLSGSLPGYVDGTAGIHLCSDAVMRLLMIMMVVVVIENMNSECYLP